jgi:hypothetical protein
MARRAERPRAVSLPVARHVVLYFGDENLGQDGGHFVNSLIRTIGHADEANRELLAKVYPEYVLAVNAAQHEHWGMDWLRDIAREVAA